MTQHEHVDIVIEIIFKGLVLLGILGLGSSLKAINCQLALIIMRLDYTKEEESNGTGD